jgi:hypothetical protein
VAAVGGALVVGITVVVAGVDITAEVAVAGAGTAAATVEGLTTVAGAVTVVETPAAGAVATAVGVGFAGTTAAGAAVAVGVAALITDGAVDAAGGAYTVTGFAGGTIACDEFLDGFGTGVVRVTSVLWLCCAAASTCLYSSSSFAEKWSEKSVIFTFIFPPAMNPNVSILNTVRSSL